MRFNECLNQYIADLGCTAKELSDASGVSTAVISRYRSGERVPQENSEQVRLLADGIALLEVKKNGRHPEPDEIFRQFVLSITGSTVSYDTFLSNLHSLLAVLQISNNQLSQALQFDPSYISRILSGQRRPAELPALINGVAEYVAVTHTSESESLALTDLTGISLRDIRSSSTCAKALAEWLGNNKDSRSTNIADFLKSMDDFDLGNFIRSLRFEEDYLERPPLEEGTRHTYTFSGALQDAELDFLACCVNSPSKDDLWLYNDMPIEFWGNDPKYLRTYMSGLAMLLKKGVHIHMIHNVYRPFQEMMLGLEGWVPLYMTGHISSYYLKSKQGETFRHLLKVSGDTVLAGEAISGYPQEGLFILTKVPEDIDYFKQRAKRLFEFAQPLFRVFRAEQSKLYRAFLQEDVQTPSYRRMIYSAPPLYTISADLLQRVMARHKVPSRDKRRILQHREQYIALMETLLSVSEMQMEIPEVSKEEYEKYPVSLELSDIFYETNLYLTYEEYIEHMRLTDAYAEAHKSCTLRKNAHAAFRNLRISIREGVHILVSRHTAPSIHCLIEQPNLRNAFENFVVPVVDE